MTKLDTTSSNRLKTAREWGIVIGDLPVGNLNLITDVAGVRVGHATLSNGSVQTGVSVVMPHVGNIFQEKVTAAAHVINGFGKSMGLMQIAELGTLETPIVLTNTLSIGTAATALIEYMLERNPAIGDTTGTVNPVVAECNDGFLNDIRGLHICKHHVRQAIDSVDIHFAQGAVGAGTGMRAYELKGGVGSASRVLNIDHQQFTIGMLVLANMGRLHDLRICAAPVGRAICADAINVGLPAAGSIIMILATDIPLSARQLGRLARRAVVGLARTGTVIDSGSGDIVLAFSTANRILHDQPQAVIQLPRLTENRLDDLFPAVADCTEEAILNAMLTAPATQGFNGHVAASLSSYIDLLPIGSAQFENDVSGL